MLKDRKQIFIDIMKRSPVISLSKLNISKYNKRPLNNISDSQLSPTEKRNMPLKQEAITEGIKEAAKESVKSETQNQQKLDVLLEKTEIVLLRIGNIFPILKSEIIIDSAKVTIIHRPFFFTESIHTITIKNLTSIYLQTVPFFATINLKDVNYIQNNFRVRWILKGRAEKARRILIGLMQTAKEGIDLKSLTDDNLAEKLEEIGKVRNTVTTVSNS